MFLSNTNKQKYQKFIINRHLDWEHSVMKRSNQLSIKNILLIITVVCIVLIIFSWDSREEISPVEKSFAYVVVPVFNGVNVFGDWLSNQYEFLTNINDLEVMNQELTDEIDELKYENKILEQDSVELERLRELYELDQRYAQFPKIGAQVIGKDAGNWYNTFIINKGSDDGLAVNMVVLAGNGLAGHIIEVGPNYAKVQSIINDTSAVSAKIMRTSDLCVVEGDQTLVNEEAFCRIEYIQDDASIIKGDEILTSHLGKIYPPGILIGTVIEIEEDPHTMTKNAILEPVVDFQHLEEVLVITNVFESVDIEE
jgi:rod shape-determining protein MreC